MVTPFFGMEVLVEKKCYKLQHDARRRCKNLHLVVAKKKIEKTPRYLRIRDGEERSVFFFLPLL